MIRPASLAALAILLAAFPAHAAGQRSAAKGAGDAAADDTLSPADRAARLARAEAGAALGKPAAQAFLGYAYVNGLGVPVDVARGLALTRQAADGGDRKAQANMGLYLANGRLLPRNDTEALRYYRLAAAQGAPVGLRGLGSFSQFGRVVPRDIAKAIAFYKQAVAAGDGFSAFRLGMIYRDGLGVPEDLVAANGWFRTAVAKGYAPAANFVAPVPAVIAGGSLPPGPPPMPRPLDDPSAPRLALVIGNAAYGPDLPALPNPVSDATLIADALKKARFKVTLVSDADQLTMKKAISDFGTQVAAAGSQATALFYYSGHGAQSQGVNYLIPVKAPVRSEADLDLYAVSTDGLLRQMTAAQATNNIIILDACRNAPFPARTRSITAGLARIDSPTGSYIAYATAPGDTASDGEGGHSPYTLALSQNLLTPGRQIEQVFKAVRRSVYQATNGDQTPWDSSSLLTDFSFVPG